MSDKNKKFLFDLNNFDTYFEEEQKKKPVEPTFSLQDMEDARNAAFAKGKTEGAQIAKDSIEQRTEILVQSLISTISALEQKESTRNQKFEQDALVLAYKTLQTLIPALEDSIAIEDVKRFLSEFFLSAIPTSGFTLTVHSDMQDAITPHAQKLSSTISIETDDTLPPSSARIDWTQGHATWKPQIVTEKILSLISAHIDDPNALKAESLDESTKKPHNKENQTDADDSVATTKDSES